MRTLILLLLLSVTAMAQPLGRMGAFVGASVPKVVAAPPASGGSLQAVVDYANTIPGIYAIYAASNAWFSSASGNATWSNLSSTAGINLTNLASGTTFQPAIVTSGLNGHAVLSFDGTDKGGGIGQYLNSANFQLTQPNEYWFVVNISNVFTAGPYLYSSVSTPRQHSLANLSTVYRMQMNAGSSANAANGTWVTNKFYVVSAAYNGATSKIYTNNVLPTMITSDAGTNGQNGLIVGAYSSVYAFLGQKLAMVLAFSTNLDHTATGVSSNLFNLITNCYGITVP